MKRPSANPLVLALLLMLVSLVSSACGGGTATTNPAPAAAESNSATATSMSSAEVEPTSPLTEPTATAENSPLPTATAQSNSSSQSQTPTEPVYTYEVVAEYPFDPTIWTQGLVYTDSVLYVGGGLRGQSDLRKTELASSEVLQRVTLEDEFFGEGVAVLGDKIYQLTWQENTAFVYGRDDLELEGTFTYSTEGWGLTHDGEQLIMSDGSDTLYFRDPETFEEMGRVSVTSSLGPIGALNELEYVDGEVFANVWTTDWIVRIDPETGELLGWINLRGLLGPEDRIDGQANVLNGIAYDAENDRLYVTGKFWPKLFEIRLVQLQ